MSKVLIIGGQKGGTGKSTITSFIANYLSNYSKLKILVIDADDLQQSLLSKRSVELNNNIYMEDKAPYRLIGSLSTQVSSLISTYDDVYDIIMVDLPGNIKQEGVLSVYALANYILFPILPDFVNLNSFLKFLELYKEEVIPIQQKLAVDCKIAAFLNNVNVRSVEVKELLAQREKYNDLIPIFQNVIPHSEVTFGREFNTYEEYKNSGSPDKYDAFITEFLEFIN